MKHSDGLVVGQSHLPTLHELSPFLSFCFISLHGKIFQCLMEVAYTVLCVHPKQSRGFGEWRPTMQILLSSFAIYSIVKLFI